MIPLLLRRIRRQPRTRLKPPEQSARKGFRAFFAKSAIGNFYWFILWCIVLLLAATLEHRDVGLRIGRPSPLTLVAQVDFSFSLDEADHDDPDASVARFPAGSVLAERGQVITPEVAGKVDAYRRYLKSSRPIAGRVSRTAGDAVILLFGVVISVAMLRVLKSDAARRNPMILLFLIISLLTIIPARWSYLLDRFQFPVPLHSLDYLLPLSLSPILAAILLGPASAIVMGFWVSLAAAIFFGYSLAVFVIGFAAAVVVARMTRFVRSRATVLRLGLFAGLAGAVCSLGFSAVSSYPWDRVVFGCLLIIISGILSALIVLLILPFFETVFKISTDISLLELSDFEHPLLKRMAIEAPGTYHHSLMVANLAQAAVAAIGGNSLRVNICSYFHDIGKLIKPSFFSENIPLTENPHDDLSPSMSTIVVTSHVKEGVNLALRHKLPMPVVEAIQQHHGTGLVYYFYHKAKEGNQLELELDKKNDVQEINEDDFRYDGPKPRSLEIAVLSLADAIEAASRSLEKISTSHIEHLVDEVVNTKLHDGQLDECDLTLAQIKCIRTAFVFTLTNMLHGRTSYPKNGNRSKQQAIGGASQHGSHKEAGSASNGTSRPL